MLRFIIFLLTFHAALDSVGQYAPRFQESEWQLAAPFAGESRDDASGFVIDGNGFLGCGADRFFNLRNDWWKFDADSQQWSEIDSLPGLPRQYATAISNGSEAFLVGGIRSDGMYSNEVFRYTTAQSWVKMEDAPFMPRAAAVAVSIGSKAFFGTGRNDTLKFSDFWLFDMEAERWHQLDSCPFDARDEMSGFEANGFIYFLLGRSFEQVFADCWRYDPLNGIWLQLPDFSGRARAYARAVAEPGGAVIAGGDSEAGELLDEAYYFDASDETWIEIADLTEPIRGMEGFRIGSAMYFCGGLTKNFTKVNTVHMLASNRVEVQSFLRVWPIPARDQLNYYFNLATGDELRLQLLNQAGVTVMEETLGASTHAGQLDLEKVGAGLYYLRLISTTQSRTISLVIVK